MSQHWIKHWRLDDFKIARCITVETGLQCTLPMGHVSPRRCSFSVHNTKDALHPSQTFPCQECKADHPCFTHISALRVRRAELDADNTEQLLASVDQLNRKASRLKAFVVARLAAMKAQPTVWASTQEAFGMQLMLLAEMLVLPEKTDGPNVMFGLMALLFAPRNVVTSYPITPEWAAQRVDITCRWIAVALKDTL